MSTLAQQIADALSGPVPDTCPIKDKASSQVVELHLLPECARKLLPLWHSKRETAAKLLKSGSSNDGGVWFRHHNEAEAIITLVYNAIRVDRGLSYRYNFELFADWTYSENGA